MRFSVGCRCCGTPISGTVLGCGNFAPTGATVAVKDTTDTTTYGTLTANSSGAYSGTVNIPSTGSYHLVATVDPADPFAARFTATTVTRTLTVGVSNTLTPITLGAATGYHCSGLIYYPLADTLHLTDSWQGVTVTLTYNTTLARWTFSQSRTYPGCASPSCPSATNVSRTWRFAGTLIQTDYSTNVGSCPALGAGTLNDATLTAALVSSSPFNATASIAAGNGSRWYCGNASTFTLTE